MAISLAPDGGFHCESMGSQRKPAHVPHDMLREVKVQIARWHQVAPPFRTRVRESAWMSRQIYAVPDTCCIVTQRLAESVEGVFDPIVSSAIAVF